MTAGSGAQGSGDVFWKRAMPALAHAHRHHGAINYASCNFRNSWSSSAQLDCVMANLRCLRETMCYPSVSRHGVGILSPSYLVKILILVAAVFTIPRLRVLLRSSLIPGGCVNSSFSGELVFGLLVLFLHAS